MDATVSVSKGCFVFNAARKKNRSKSSKNVETFEMELWNKSYTMLQNSLDQTLQTAYDGIYSSVLKDLVHYVEHSHDESRGSFIPVATLLTGINMPDHSVLFERLASLLHAGVTPHVATLHARDCGSIKACVEQVVGQLMNASSNVSSDEEDSDDEEREIITKHHCNFIALESWYREIVSSKLSDDSKTKSPSKQSKENRSPSKSNRDLDSPSVKPPKSPLKRMTEHLPHTCSKRSKSDPILIVVIPEFEVFNMKVLQSLISLVSFHASVLPITFVFGVATSVQALQQGLTFRVSSKLRIEVFHSQKSITFLDHVLEEVLLNENALFILGEKTFKLFCEVFLFYDFSVKGFTQQLKFCMMEHFFGRDIMSLCCPLPEVPKVLGKLTKRNLKELRDLSSFQKYLQKCSSEERETLLNDDKYFKIEVEKLIVQLRTYMHDFYLTLRVLHILCSTLPNTPLGLQVRKVYEIAISGKLFDSKEYKECMKLLSFQSREELLLKLRQVIDVLAQVTDTLSPEQMAETVETLREHYVRLEHAGQGLMSATTKSPSSPKKKQSLAVDTEGKKVSRTQFMLNMKESCSKERSLSEFEQTRKDLLEYLSSSLSALPSLASLPLNEVVLFDDIATVKQRLVGAPRAALHMALNNPNYYLQCDCCTIPSSSAILSSLPDVCVAYKLHLECGKLINLYDWLQSFIAIIQMDEECKDNQEEREVSPETQARFARAVAELQFLGFIKVSKKKTDHVSRLTSNPS